MTPMFPATRVLLVDDDPTILGPLRRVVEQERPDAAVVYATELRTALWQLRSTAVRLVVTDLRMRDDARAGVEVVELARSLGVPVAVITGSDDPAELAPLVAANVRVLRKHAMSRTELQELVKAAFREERASQLDDTASMQGGLS